MSCPVRFALYSYMVHYYDPLSSSHSSPQLILRSTRVHIVSMPFTRLFPSLSASSSLQVGSSGFIAISYEGGFSLCFLSHCNAESTTLRLIFLIPFSFFPLPSSFFFSDSVIASALVLLTLSPTFFFPVLALCSPPFNHDTSLMQFSKHHAYRERKTNYRAFTNHAPCNSKSSFALPLSRAVRGLFLVPPSLALDVWLATNWDPSNSICKMSQSLACK